MKYLDVTKASAVLKDWYGVTLPDRVLREIIASDTHLLIEVETGGIGDTEERSDLVNAVLQKLGMRSWPLYGDGEVVFNAFIVELREKIKTIGGTLDE